MIRINDNGDLVRYTKAENHNAGGKTLATAAELKAAYAEKGMVLVPLEPTTDMLIAGQMAKRHYPPVPSGTAEESVYRAMLNAAIKEAP